MYYVYILWSSKLRKRYTGSTDNIPLRIKQHNRGGNRFTKGGIPWILIYSEEYHSKTESLKRENFLKTGQGRKWLDSKFPNYRKGAGVV